MKRSGLKMCGSEKGLVTLKLARRRKGVIGAYRGSTLDFDGKRRRRGRS